MPVHEITYREYEGEKIPPALSVLAVPKFTLLSTGNRFFVTWLFAVGSILLVLGIGYLYIVTNPTLAGFLKMGNMPVFPASKIFFYFMSYQTKLAFPLLIVLAPKLISPELHHRALPLVYSRPVTRLNYIIGKMLAVAAPLSYLYIFQVVVLFITMMALFPTESQFWQDFGKGSLPAFFGALAVGGFAIILQSLIVTIASAATKNPRYAAFIVLAIVFGSRFVVISLAEIVHFVYPELSPPQLIEALTALLLDPASAKEVSMVRVLFAAAFWMVAPTLFMLWRLRPVDIYKE